MTFPTDKTRIVIDTLRDRIAEALAAAVKSYSLPAVCVRLGLPEGDDSEAFQSKRLYVKKRLLGLKEPELLRIAGEVLREYEAPELQDVISEMTTHAEHRITTLTRRELLKATIPLDPLFGDLGRMHLQDHLSVLSPPWGKASESGKFLDTLADDVQQHYVRNPEDWDNFDLLEKCDALSCSQERFFALLEKLLHPIVRRGEEQMGLACTLNALLKPDGFCASIIDHESGHPVYGIRRLAAGVSGTAKNLIFASIGEKPELVFRDAINNDVEITRNADKCLVFDQPLPNTGLLWTAMATWWQEIQGLKDLKSARKSLGERLMRSVELTRSPGEYAIFRTYYEVFNPLLGDLLPALIPQVYLHYDPLTIKERGDEKVLIRQRMDFLMLLENNVRIVVEVDGKQHYAEGDRASPKLYADMAAEDRGLRLRGHELYRFGGAEFPDACIDCGRYTVGPQSKALITKFFSNLFLRHRVRGASP